MEKDSLEKEIEIISVNGLDSEVSEAAQEHFDYLYDMYAHKYGENFTNRVDYHTDIRPQYNSDLKREAQMFLQNDREKVQETKEEKVVGAIIYHDTGERVEFTDEKQYLQHIKDDLYVLGDGFHTETVKRDAELHKAVDDMLYGEYAVENPHDLKYYENKLGIEKKGTVDNKKRISDVNIFSLNTGGMAIRCKIDGIQQLAEKMTKHDVNNLNEETDRIDLAKKYFKEQLYKETVGINNSFKR